MITTRPTDTDSRSARRAPQLPSRTAVPPPMPMRDLRDGDTVVGWIHRRAIGFRGFGSETEAAHAASLAYRTMASRFAPGDGRPSLVLDGEPISLARSGDVELILAASRPVATLLRPGADGRSGPDWFGFEIQVPLPVGEVRMRSTAYRVYRELRRSGLPWAMWAPAPPPPPPSPANESPAEDPSPATGDAAALAGLRDDSSGILGTVLIILAMLSVVILPAITASTVVTLLGGAAGLVAFAALVSLVRLVVTDVTGSLREPGRPTRGEPADDARLPAAARGAA